MIIFYLLLTYSAFAQDLCNHNHVDEIKDFQGIIDWLGASSFEIENAPCKTKLPPKLSSINSFISKPHSNTQSRSVHNIEFTNEDPVLVKHFEDLVTSRNITGLNIKPEAQINIQEKFKINPECKQVLCAIKKIWGDELGPKLLYVKMKHGYNASELAFSHSERFSLDEINDVIMGLDDLPSHIIPLANPNQPLTHLKRGTKLKINEFKDVAANNLIMLFDPWDQKSSREKQYTVFHELSHNIASKYNSLDQTSEWLNLSDWVKKEDKWSHNPEKSMVSQYSKDNPSDDFAETLSAYRYNASYLKEKCPLKYEFVKTKVFNNIEYLNVVSCSEIPTAQLSKAKIFLRNQLLENLNEKLYSTEDVVKFCAGIFKNYPPTSSESALCSLSLVFQDPSSSIDKIISKSLKQANIPDNDKNRNDLLSTMTLDNELENKLLKKIKGVSKATDGLVKLSFENAMPDGIGELSQYDSYWIYGDYRCSDHFFGGKKEDLLKCQAKVMVEEDKTRQPWNTGKFPKYQLPSIYSPEVHGKLNKLKDEKLLNHLISEPEFKRNSLIKIAEFKNILDLQQLSVMSVISESTKDLPPKEFCEKTYGNSSMHLERYGLRTGSQVPALQKWCEDIQATRTRRFEVSPEDWNQMVIDLLPH